MVYACMCALPIGALDRWLLVIYKSRACCCLHRRGPCRYERALVEPELHGLGDELLAKFAATEAALLQVVKHSRLLSSSSTAVLQQKLQLREPYVTPLNILQASASALCLVVACSQIVSAGISRSLRSQPSFPCLIPSPSAPPSSHALHRSTA